MKNKLFENGTIVVNSCDGYADVLSIFFKAFDNHWRDCPFKVVINTESNQYPQYDAITYNYISCTNSDDWGQRLLNTLAAIDSDYVIMLYDDYILERDIDIREFAHALEFIQNREQAAALFLVKTPLALDDEEPDKRYLNVHATADYRLNSAPAIWRKEILSSYIRSGDNPWAWEVFGSYRTFNDGKEFFTLNPAHADIYDYDYTAGGAIYRGKWVKKVIDRAILKYDMKINWSFRGMSNGQEFEKRSMLWRIRFLKLGFKMIGIKMIFYFYRYAREKYLTRIFYSKRKQNR